MNRTLIGIVVVIAVVVVGIAAVAGWDGPGNHDRTEVGTIVTSEDGETLVLFDDNRRGFFPAGLLFFPFFWIALIGIGFLLFRRIGPFGSGPPGPPSNRWLEEWHQSAHDRGSRDDSTESAS